jgi:hypothetical protein
MYEQKICSDLSVQSIQKPLYKFKLTLFLLGASGAWFTFAARLTTT